MSCYFDSLSHFFHVKSGILRQEICNYLEANAPIIDDMETAALLDVLDKDYIKKMRRDETWAGGIEISATCNIWGISVVVYSHHAKPIVFQPLNKKPRDVINLLWTGNHYQPLEIRN